MGLDCELFIKEDNEYNSSIDLDRWYCFKSHFKSGYELSQKEMLNQFRFLYKEVKKNPENFDYSRQLLIFLPKGIDFLLTHKKAQSTVFVHENDIGYKGKPRIIKSLLGN